MDAISLLTDEHKQLKKLLNELLKTSQGAIKTREKLFAQFKQMLTRHEEMEERVFYPALKKQDSNTKEKVTHAYEEHHVADLIVKELKNLSCSDGKFDAKLAVLKENLEHHIQEEEEDLFPRASRDFDKPKLQQLAQDMQAAVK